MKAIYTYIYTVLQNCFQKPASKVTLLLLLAVASITPSLAGDKKRNRIVVMSYNLRFDNPGDGINRWDNRRERVISFLTKEAPDFLGTQELLHHQIMDLLSGLKGYNYTGKARDDGKESGEYSALFYKSDRFNRLEGGTFWLSETPSIPGSRGWDAACNRVVTWGRFIEKKSRQEILVFNTHFDHQGEVARRESAKLLLRKIGEISGRLPFVVTGDFNATRQSEVYRLLTLSGEGIHLNDAGKIARKQQGPGWTFHGFGKVALPERSYIDYIFLSEHLKSLAFSILNEPEEPHFLSDHLAVKAIIQLREKDK